MIISYALTEKEYILGRKTVTRRKWKPRHVKTWQRAWDNGKLVHQAWSKVPYAGGVYLGDFELICRPYLEPLEMMPEADLLAEGGMCETLEEFIVLIDLPPATKVAVVRFKPLHLEESAIRNWGAYPHNLPEGVMR